MAAGGGPPDPYPYPRSSASCLQPSLPRLSRALGLSLSSKSAILLPISLPPPPPVSTGGDPAVSGQRPENGQDGNISSISVSPHQMKAENLGSVGWLYRTPSDVGRWLVPSVSNRRSRGRNTSPPVATRTGAKARENASVLGPQPVLTLTEP